jgi:hypothetical protein
MEVMLHYLQAVAIPASHSDLGDFLSTLETCAS